MGEQAPILLMEDASLVRGGRRLFAGLSLALAPGAAALVTGPNGVGKSSLLRLAGGLLRAGAGRVTRAGGVALAADRPALDEEAALADALGFWARLDPAPGAGDPDERVEHALETVALLPLARVPVRLLSAGQRRRAALARVAASGAALWLLDEPATGLDLSSVERLEAMVAAHRAAGGAAMVATHQPLALPGALAVSLAPPAAGEAWA